jgi:hypothetical protein
MRAEIGVEVTRLSSPFHATEAGLSAFTGAVPDSMRIHRGAPS